MRRLILTSYFLLAVVSIYGQQKTLIHYWNFNDLENHLKPAYSIGGADLSTEAGLNNFAGTSLNARKNDPAGRDLAITSPAGNELYIKAPTTNFRNITLTYAARRTSTGAAIHKIYYSTGQEYKLLKEVYPGNGQYELITLTFPEVEEINNNEDFTLKIHFEEGEGGNAGNNRIDNLTVEGYSLNEETPAHYEIFFIAHENNLPFEGLNININNTSLRTSEDGRADIALSPGTYTYSCEAIGIKPYTNSFTLTDSDLTIEIPLERIEGQPEEGLLHYWNFNNTEEQQISNFTIGGANLEILPEGNNDFAGTEINARNGDLPGRDLTISNPAGKEMILTLPTSGYNNIQFKYACRRSATGAGKQIISYSIGDNYIPFDTINPSSSTYQLKSVDFSEVEQVNNQENFKIKISFIEGEGGEAGNNRFDNITLEGSKIEEQEQQVTFIVSGSEGAIPEAEIQLNNQTIFTNTEGTATINLSSGDYSFRIIAEGYIPVEDSFTLTNNAKELDIKLNHQETEPEEELFQLQFQVSHLSQKVENALISINDRQIETDENGQAALVLPIGSYRYSISKNGYFAWLGEIELIENRTIKIELKTDNHLIHYWNFNQAISHNHLLKPSFTRGDALISYGGEYDEVKDGSEINIRNSDENGYALRLRNPADTLLLHLPTTGFNNVVLKYAAKRPENGMLIQKIRYSIDGINFTSDLLEKNELEISTDYSLHTIDFRSIPESFDNPNFKIEITFNGQHTSELGNNRLDNITLESSDKTISNVISHIIDTSKLRVFPNPAQDADYLTLTKKASIKLYNVNGLLIRQEHETDKLYIKDLPPGWYQLVSEEGEKVSLILN